MYPPIAVQVSFKNANIDWSKCVQPYPVDKHAFRVYSCGTCIGKPRSGKRTGSELERLAKSYARQKVVKSIIKSGTFKHQRCILPSLLSDPAIRNIASSIGVNIHKIRLGQQLLTSVTKLLKHATKTKNKNHRVSKLQRNVIQTIGAALMRTPTKDGNESIQNEISIRQLSKRLGLSNGLGWQTLTQGKKRREAIAECNADGWIMINDDDKRTKYSDDLLDDLES
jgi:hypothetical protein